LDQRVGGGSSGSVSLALTLTLPADGLLGAVALRA
jgi:hypothetical protein